MTKMFYIAIGIATTTAFLLLRNYTNLMHRVALRLNESANECSVNKIKEGTYQVIYSIAGKEYRMLVKPDRGPTEVKIMGWFNEQQGGHDVTEEVLPYLGPNANSFVGQTIMSGENFSNPSVPFGPSDFGYHKLSISVNNPEE